MKKLRYSTHLLSSDFMYSYNSLHSIFKNNHAKTIVFFCIIFSLFFASSVSVIAQTTPFKGLGGFSTSSTTSTTPSTETVPSYPNKPSETIKKLDIGNIKMIQVSLNLLGYDAGKVDGKTADSFRTAINKFQTDENITASGEVDGKTCLLLSRKIKEKFPDDANAKELHNNLLRLYLQMYAQ